MNSVATPSLTSALVPDIVDLLAFLTCLIASAKNSNNAVIAALYHLD